MFEVNYLFAYFYIFFSLSSQTLNFIILFLIKNRTMDLPDIPKP